MFPHSGSRTLEGCSRPMTIKSLAGLLSIAVVLSTAAIHASTFSESQSSDTTFQTQAEKANEEAIALADKGELPRAIERFKQARELYRLAHNPKGEAKVLRNLGQASYLLGKDHKDESLNYFSQARLLYRSAGDREGEGQSLFRIGQVLYDTRDPKAALAAFDEAIPLLPESWMRDNEGWLRSMMADCYYASGDPSRAIETYKLALNHSQTAKDENLRPNIIEQIGLISLLEGDKSTAAIYLTQARDAWHALKRPNREAAVWKSLAILSERLGDYVGAISNYEQAHSMFKALGLEREEAEALNLIGLFYAALGNPQRAITYHTAARKVLERTDDRKAQAWTSMQIAYAYRGMDDYVSSRDALKTALEVFKDLKDQEGIASALFYLGLAHEAEGEFSEALNYLSQSLTISQTNKDVVNELRTLGQIGQIYTKQGNKTKALENVENEIAVSKKVTSPEIKAPLLSRIGINYVLLGNDREAINYYQQSLDIYRRMGNKHGIAESLAAIGAAYEFLGSFPEALTNYQESILIRDELRTGARVEELQTGIAGQNASTYQYAARLAVKLNRPAQAFEFSERARARGLLDQLGNTRIDPKKGADPKLVQREETLRAELSALEKQNVSERAQPAREMMGLTQNPRKSAEEIDGLQSEYDALRLQLKASNPEYASMRTIDPLALAEVQKLLDQDTTLISYFITLDQTQAFIISKTSFQAVTLSVGEPALQAAVRKFRGFGDTSNPDLPNLQKLHEWLVKPLKPYLKTPLIGIVPHGVLHYLPFAALTDGKRFFGEDYKLFYLPSTSILAFMGQKRKPDKSTLLSISQSQSEGMALLTYSDLMATEIAKLYETTALLGANASETALRSAAGNSGIVFVAAHGLLNTQSPLFSRIMLAPDKENDGMLEVHEVYMLDLKKTDLVVLSSCQTQLGQQSRGDDIVGLNRAFIYAGAPTVVASLWSVEEKATSELMITFFRNLKQGMSKAAALQAAQAQTRRQYPSPYYWAGFVLTGDPR